MTTLALPATSALPRPRAPRRPRFKVGTTGWSFDSFDDPEFEDFYLGGRYEICEGVLTTMPAHQDGTQGLGELVQLLGVHTRTRLAVKWAANPEVDLVMTPTRIVRVDMAFLTPLDQARQRQARASRNLPPERRRRGLPIFVPPTIVVESVSAGHEAHDRQTKRAWYAEFGVPHYWILDALARRLDCLALVDGRYEVAAAGTDRDEVRPPVPEGLVIPLADLWVD